MKVKQQEEKDFMSSNRIKIECTSCDQVYIIENDDDNKIVTCCYCGSELEDNECEPEDEMEDE